MTQSFLISMAKESQQRFQDASNSVTERDLLSLCEDMDVLELINLPRDDFHIIAEIKKQSPSLGSLTLESFDLQKQAMSYIEGGSSLLSVLTEPSKFLGELEDLELIASLENNIPVMRKDFLVHPYQISEARYYGAAGVLIIVAILDERKLQAMIQRALDHGMFVLLETFTKQELHLATNMLNRFDDKASQLLIGVNCRNLNTLQVDFSNFTKLAANLPNTAMCVAESGVHDLNDLQRIIEMGFGAALIGSALMQSDNPRTTLNEMKKFAHKTMVARQ